MIQFLIDEDVTPRLRDVANGRGYNAYHIQHLDWKGRQDFAIRRRMLDEDLTLVTGNWKDFRPMLQREEVHPGAISLPDVPRAEQIRLFEAALAFIESADPPVDMINRVLVVNDRGQVSMFEIPDPALASSWRSAGCSDKAAKNNKGE
ncbi:DUF5615 family PIN-like protein [Longimicrobium terrae]|uniref:Putative nuclease of putative toxin-antitoxin system n=1 Tax=Longimicrobium terrae TaxID=1639882 RepID=A0A841GXE4_9BACT|nr:putative nuclease of putative toxin-antitoxin system [Longimicrobium terrae]MBB6070126.1 putative nuclease of putative toxin-antitoxin system [Longimicrobium terrae]NNC33028.1 DUF5615 family PIN-like protein [Longimicrobium terrae]